VSSTDRSLRELERAAELAGVADLEASAALERAQARAGLPMRSPARTAVLGRLRAALNSRMVHLCSLEIGLSVTEVFFRLIEERLLIYDGLRFQRGLEIGWKGGILARVLRIEPDLSSHPTRGTARLEPEPLSKEEARRRRARERTHANVRRPPPRRL